MKCQLILENPTYIPDGWCRRFVCGLLMLATCCLPGYGQADSPPDSTILTPGFSAFLIKKDQLEYGWYMGYGINYPVYNARAPYQELGKQNLTSSSLQTTYGLTRPGARIQVNAGLDWEVLMPGDNRVPFEAKSQHSISPRVRWTPFPKGLYGLQISFQHSLSLPLNKQGARTRHQLMGVRQFRSGWMVLGQLDFVTLPQGPEDDISPIATGVSAYLAYQYSRKWIPFAFISRFSESGDVPWVEEDKRYRRGSGTLIGAGIQHVLTRRLQVFGNLAFGLQKQRGSGAASSLNLGLRGTIW